MKKIQISDLIQILNPGYVAMDATGDWYWYRHKPEIAPVMAVWKPTSDLVQRLSSAFNIEKTDIEWEKSLIKVQ